MSLTNKEIVEHFFTEIYNKKNYAAAHTLFTPNYRDNGPDQARSPEDAIEIFKGAHRAFPDLHVAVLDLFAEGDKVAFRGRFRGTHRSEFAGVAATNRPVDFEALEVFRLEAGKIAESWGYWPDALIVRQLQRL